MKLPKMILFDYGQTLVNEQKFDGIKGRQFLNMLLKINTTLQQNRYKRKQRLLITN